MVLSEAVVSGTPFPKGHRQFPAIRQRKEARETLASSVIPEIRESGSDFRNAFKFRNTVESSAAAV